MEREELPETGRLDLQHSFGVVGVIERQDVEARAVADLLSGPHDLVGEVIPTESFQTMAFHIEDEMFAELAEVTIGGVTLSGVDLPGLA
jgi:hypothetical protein